MGKRLYVGNLSFDTTEATLSDAFGQGNLKVSSVTVMLDRDTGRSRGFGFIGFPGRVGMPPEITVLELQRT